MLKEPSTFRLIQSTAYRLAPVSPTLPPLRACWRKETTFTFERNPLHSFETTRGNVGGLATKTAIAAITGKIMVPAIAAVYPPLMS